MRFASLGSGSRGNSTVVEQGTTLLLIDNGFSVRETERRLQRLGRDGAAVTALLVTHEHSDHVGGIAVFARKYRVPVWMTPGTLAGCRDRPEQVQLFNSHAPFAIGDIAVEPYPVPHDAREPAQFVLGNGAVRLGLLTDAGSLTAHMDAKLNGCDALFLECNHDPLMLANGPYPPVLKRRVGGNYGHLSNDQAATLLRRLDCSRLQHIVCAHLSEKNNLPELAVAAVGTALGCEAGWVGVAQQNAGLDWREVR